MADFWNSVLRVEGLWNSPLRVEVLRIVATTIFFVLGIVAGGSGRCGGAIGRSKWRSAVSLRTSSRSRRSFWIAGRTAARSYASGPAGATRWRRSSPTSAARDEFQARAGRTTTPSPLVSMDGKMGSYLLQELAIWVCGQLRETQLPARRLGDGPCVRARGALSGRSLLVDGLAVRLDDLLRFRDWDDCSDIQVEHASHGERILTLMGMAAEYDQQAAAVADRRAAGRRSNFEETMYILDLGLDTQSARSAGQTGAVGPV